MNTINECDKIQQNIEDQIDYKFIQRIVQELTQSCALPLPVPAAAIPSLILQAADYFYENYDNAVEERYYFLPYSEITKCGLNKLVTLPERIVSVFGVYKTDQSNYHMRGDFSLERMVLNNNASFGGYGMSGYSNGINGNQQMGYNLMDSIATLYEISTYQSVLEYPITFDYNNYSNVLSLLGELNGSNLIIHCYIRCRLQDLYKSHYFFRYCVALGLRSMSTILGTFDYKLPGGITLNHDAFAQRAESEIDKIEEWIKSQHSPDYFFNSNTI